MEPTRYLAPTRQRLVPALLSLGLLLAPSAFAQDSGEADPWFGEALENGSVDETVDIDLPAAKAPRTLYRIALKRFDETLPSQLSKRIAILEEAIAVYPDDPKGVAATLDELKRTRENALDALRGAGAISKDIEAALARIAPYADYFSSDPSLLLEFLESSFASDFERQVKALGESGDFSRLIAISQQVDRSGIGKALGQRFENLVANALSTVVATQWLARSHALLPGERYLAGRLLSDAQRKLQVAVKLPADAPESLQRNLLRSLERRWGDDFSFTPEAEAEADITLAVETDGITTRREVDEASIASLVPGRVTETPNPEFMELTKKYEKAAERYEIAMRVYETEYERYIENAKDEEWNRAQQNLERAETAAASVTPISGPSGPGQEYESAQANLDLARAVANSTTSTTTPEPIKPRPVHLEVLDELYRVPSTLVSSEDPTPYEYTQRTLTYLLSANARLKLLSRIATADQPVALKQERTWTQNLNVDPADASATVGDFSEQELNSAVSLFTLAFGSDCAKAFADLLDQARTAAPPAQFGPQALPDLTLALALRAQAIPTDQLQLSRDEIKRLALLANDPAVDPAAFRAHCLALATQKLNASPSLDPDQIEPQLRQDS